MTSLEIAAGLVDWVKDTLAAANVADPTFDALAEDPASTPESEWPLPDAAVAITSIPQAKGAPAGRLQQGVERAYACELMLACHPDPPDSAGRWLYKAVDLLMDELLRDRTLQGRVPTVDVGATASFEPPFAELEDGARARVATLTLTVRQRVGS